MAVSERTGVKSKSTTDLSNLQDSDNNNNVHHTEEEEAETDSEEEDSDLDHYLNLDDLPVFHSSSRHSTRQPLSPLGSAALSMPPSVDLLTGAVSRQPSSSRTTPAPGTTCTSPATTSALNNLSAASAASTAATSAASSAATMTTMTTSNTSELASLYIGDLHADTTETMLYALFATCGAIASVRVCRDSQSQRSLGYAYINYTCREAAERAINELGFTEILGRECRVAWAIKNKTALTAATTTKTTTTMGPVHGGTPNVTGNARGITRSMPKGSNLCVRNLHPSVTSKVLWSTFKVFGAVVSCKVAINETTGESLCRGYVQYETLEVAQEAIRQTNNVDLNGQAMVVDVYMSRAERETQLANSVVGIAKQVPVAVAAAEAAPVTLGSLRVTGLAMDATEQDVRGLFAEFGKIHSVYLAPPPHTPFMGDTTKAQAVVHFTTLLASIAAKSIVDGLNFMGSHVRVTLIESGLGHDTAAARDRIYMVAIKRLPYFCDIRSLYDYLRQMTHIKFGEVTIYRQLPGSRYRSCSIQCKSRAHCIDIVQSLAGQRMGELMINAFVAETRTPAKVNTRVHVAPYQSTLMRGMASSPRLAPERQWRATNSLASRDLARPEYNSHNYAYNNNNNSFEHPTTDHIEPQFAHPSRLGRQSPPPFSQRYMAPHPGPVLAPASTAPRRVEMQVRHVPRPTGVAGKSVIVGHYYFGLDEADRMPRCLVISQPVAPVAAVPAAMAEVPEAVPPALAPALAPEPAVEMMAVAAPAKEEDKRTLAAGSGETVGRAVGTRSETTSSPHKQGPGPTEPSPAPPAKPQPKQRPSTPVALLAPKKEKAVKTGGGRGRGGHGGRSGKNDRGADKKRPPRRYATRAERHAKREAKAAAAAAAAAAALVVAGVGR